MLKVQSPLTGVDNTLRPKSGRKPLQPKNTPATPLTEIHILKPIPPAKDSNKENNSGVVFGTPAKNKVVVEQVALLDASLAEELSAIRKRIERLRLEREKTEKMLKERDEALDLQMKEIEKRGEAQKMLEMEVDRLFRLKELQSYSMRISPIRTLREKEHDKKFGQAHLQIVKAKDFEESVTGSTLQSPSPSPSSSASSNSISSQLIEVK